MVRMEEAVPARLKTHGTTFEVLVEPDGALALKRGDSVNLEDILAVEDIFENASRGDRSAEEDLIKAFGTTDAIVIAKTIITKGEISLTAEQRKRFIENKRRQVIEVIARNAINPQTRTPHPPGRIEQAMTEARVNIDPSKSTDELVKITMKAIRPLIPIRFEEVEAGRSRPIMLPRPTARSRPLAGSPERPGRTTAPGLAWSKYRQECKTTSTRWSID
jgi:ribosome maturation protein SDO1